MKRRSSRGAFTVRHICFAAPLFLVGGAIGFPLGFALSQAAPQMRVQVVMQQRVADIPLPANIEVRDDRWDPGAETGAHEHPGPVILAVIEGELVEETARGRNVLRAGQAFWRPAREMHNVKNAGAGTARVLAIHFDPAR
ncbi:MAG: cupin domain-containing protein [Hyphomicrobiaceae bacterium]|nr:MAG: cupin domain-containing protein [Hyphomicrobiaceae bacterium]